MVHPAEIAARSDTGRQRRENEDSLFVREPLFVVADGMGGAQAGEVASRLAVEFFQEGLPADGSPEERLATVVKRANGRIHELSQAEGEHRGMGTTLTAALLEDGQLAIAHVGDSRAYLYGRGELRRLTEDHSLVAELVRRGKLTEDQAEEHPQRSVITRALGVWPEVEVDTWSYPVRAGDVLLLCSDGLTSMLAEEQIRQVLEGEPSLERAASGLIERANRAGGRDNITVILVRMDEAGAGGLEPPTSVSAVPAAARVPERRAGKAPRRAPRAAPRARRTRIPAALLAGLIAGFLVLAGGYLATRQLYFIGTDQEGIVTIYRGLPYELPAGVRLYETYYVSGVPAGLVPADRRSRLLSHDLRSQSDAQSLVRALELGRISG